MSTRQSAEERLKALEEQKAQAKANFRQRMARLDRQSRHIKGKGERAHHRQDTQAKIVVGAIAMNYIADNPRDQWFRKRLIEDLKANPKVPNNPALVAFLASLTAKPAADSLDGQQR